MNGVKAPDATRGSQKKKSWSEYLLPEAKKNGKRARGSHGERRIACWWPGDGGIEGHVFQSRRKRTDGSWRRGVTLPEREGKKRSKKKGRKNNLGPPIHLGWQL